MFGKNEKTKGLAFFDRYTSKAQHETFGEKHYLTAPLKLEYKPSISFPESKFDFKSTSPDSFHMTKSTHSSNNNYATDSSFNFGKFAERTLDVQALQFAWYAYHEELVRSKALLNLEMVFVEIGSHLFGPKKYPKWVTKSDVDVLAELMNFTDLEFRNLYDSATPIGKATLPARIRFDIQHQEVLHLADKGNFIKAASTLFEEIQKKYYLNQSVIDKLKFANRAFGVAEVGAISYKIGTSDDKVAAAEEETVLWSGGLAGGYQAGKLALPYCSKLFTPVAKTVCHVGATVVGSILGTEVAHDLYQKVIKKNEDRSDKSFSNASDGAFTLAIEKKSSTLDVSNSSQEMRLSEKRYIETSPVLNEFFHEFEADGKLNPSR